MRKALLISTNNRIDRDGEIVSTRALADYVQACHDERGNYIGNSKMLIWHAGDAIGQVLDCDLMNGFLIEVCEELPDSTVNIGTSDETVMASIKAVWDAIESEQDNLGVSQGFLYDPATQDDEGVFHHILKYESSILPIDRASNPYTFVRVFNSE
jgi:hypothetical protein